MKGRLAGADRSILFLILIFFLLVITALVMLFASRTDPIADTINNDQIIKILFVLENKGKILFTDVLGYYPRSGRGVLYDIPGNTGAIYSSLGRVDRIDAVYAEKGIDVYRKEVETLVGQDIPFSVIFTLDDFTQLVDYFGGLRVFVPSPVDIAGENGERWLLPSGAVVLDGDKVRTYLQYTAPDETLGDVQDRRQNVMVAFLGALNSNTADMFSRKVFRCYEDLFSVNIGTQDFRKLLAIVSGIDAERIVLTSIIGSSRVVDGQALLFPLYDGQLFKDSVKQTLGSLLSTSDPAQARVYVLEIQNSTSVQGLARNTSTLLQGAGYDVLSTVNAEGGERDKTVIIDHIGNAEAARTLGDFINCTNIVTDSVSENSSSDYLVDFTIILGKDFDGRYVR